MPNASPQAPRTTIVIGAALNTLLVSNRVPAPSQSGRIDRLAERYLAIMEDKTRFDFTNAQLATIFLACEDLDLAVAKDAYVVVVRVKQIEARVSELRWPCNVSDLSYRLGSMSLTDLLRLVDLAERYRGREINPDAVGVWYAANR